jgi:hypothetical protein
MTARTLLDSWLTYPIESQREGEPAYD